MAMREQNPPGYILAVLADFRHQASLSKVLHGAAVPATPLTIARLQKLADLVGYRGPLVAEEPGEARQ